MGLRRLVGLFAAPLVLTSGAGGLDPDEAGRPHADLGPAACRPEFLPFLHTVDKFWRGNNVSEPHLAFVAMDMITIMGKWCPPAKATAHVLMAELSVWLSRPMALEVPAGPQRAEYDAEVWRYARSHAEEAAALFDDGSTAAAFSQVGDGKSLLLLEAFNPPWPDIAGILMVSMQASALREPDDSTDGWSPFTMAIFDHTWGEVWLPATLGDGQKLWPITPGVLMNQPPAAAAASGPVEQMVPLLETALRLLMVFSMDKLKAQAKHSALAAYWPSSSTLIAALRYGSLFGSLRKNGTDCIDDDLDLTVVMPPEPGAWPRFVRSMGSSMEEAGCECHVGASAQRLRQMRGRYTTLLCHCMVNEFLLPVSFERHGAERPEGNAEVPAMGKCGMYGFTVPCPLDPRPHLAKYGGCLALPDARQAALTVGNACVDWMRGGLRDAEVETIRGHARRLAQEGLVSMEVFWDDPACQDTRRAWAEAAEAADAAVAD